MNNISFHDDKASHSTRSDVPYVWMVSLVIRPPPPSFCGHEGLEGQTCNRAFPIGQLGNSRPAKSYRNSFHRKSNCESQVERRLSHGRASSASTASDLSGPLSRLSRHKWPKPLHLRRHSADRSDHLWRDKRESGPLRAVHLSPHK